MFQKLEDVEKRYEELNKLISDPEVISNQTEWKKLMKEHSSIEEVVMKYREYKNTEKAMEEAKEMMSDPELKELAEEDMLNAKNKLPILEEELKILLIPKDPNDDNNVIYNCYMYKDMRESEKKCRLGLFGAYLFGEVKNLGLVNINSVLLNQDLEGTNSGIAGSLKANGKISNCYISGDIKQYSTGKGNVNCSGFIVYNSGTIENSFNLANIYGEIKDKSTAGGCYLRRACCK